MASDPFAYLAGRLNAAGSGGARLHICTVSSVSPMKIFVGGTEVDEDFLSVNPALRMDYSECSGCDYFLGIKNAPEPIKAGDSVAVIEDGSHFFVLFALGGE